jgi:hypothetical protein
MSGLVGITRDRAIVQKTADLLESHSNVLVVFGASHLMTQLPALEALLGKPEYLKPF